MGNRNNKKVSFYVVIDRSNGQILTIACNKQDCLEYGYKYLRLKHFDHFKMWCELRSLSIDSEAAWATYFTKVLTYEEKAGYAIAKKTYKLNNLAAVLRMFGGCFPLGCSFDTETEYLYLKTKLEAQEEALQKIHDNVEKMIKEEKPQETATNGK